MHQVQKEACMVQNVNKNHAKSQNNAKESSETNIQKTNIYNFSFLDKYLNKFTYTIFIQNDSQRTNIKHRMKYKSNYNDITYKNHNISD